MKSIEQNQLTQLFTSAQIQTTYRHMNKTHKEFATDNFDASTPVLLLGGRENSLSLARSFGQLGISVKISGRADCWGLYSKFCTKGYPVPRGTNPEVHWAKLLLSDQAHELHGHLVIACNDASLLFIAKNVEKLQSSFILLNASADQQLSLLDKKQTLKMAQGIGVPTPKYWNVSKPQDLEEIKQSIQFPVMVKPLLSHEFIKIFGRKLFIIQDSFDELTSAVHQAWDKNQDIMIVEMIPGPDSALTSYYTYADRSGELLFDYTKCVIRRYPLNRGAGCYHKSSWLPETAQMGRKFFKGIGLRGFGNIEFKRDPRDGQLKVIECNARFTAAQELVAQSGAPIDLIVYCSATNQQPPQFSNYDPGKTLLYVPQDFLSFLELNGKGLLGPLEWIKSLLPYRHISPLHNITDPYPSLGAFYARILKMLGRNL